MTQVILGHSLFFSSSTLTGSASGQIEAISNLAEDFIKECQDEFNIELIGKVVNNDSRYAELYFAFNISKKDHFLFKIKYPGDIFKYGYCDAEFGYITEITWNDIFYSHQEQKKLNAHRYA